jgi:single-strand DNA-binding protein
VDIQYTKWTDKDGVERHGCEVVAETIDFLSRAKPAEFTTSNDRDQDDEIPV